MLYNGIKPIQKIVASAIASMFCLGFAYAQGFKFTSVPTAKQGDMSNLSGLVRQHIVSLPKGVQQSDIQSTHLTQAKNGMAYLSLVTQSGQLFIFKSRYGRYGISPYGYWVKPELPDLSHGSYRIQDALLTPNGVLALATDIGLFRAKDIRFDQDSDNQLSLSHWVFRNQFPETNLRAVGLFPNQSGQLALCVLSDHDATCQTKDKRWQAVMMPEDLLATTNDHYKIVGAAPPQKINLTIKPNKQGDQPVVKVSYYGNTGKLIETDDVTYDKSFHATIDVGHFFQQKHDGKIEDPYWYKNHQLGRVEVTFYSQKGDVLTEESVAQFEVDLDAWSPYVNNQAGQINLSDALYNNRDGWQLSGTLANSAYQLQLVVPDSAGTKKAGVSPLGFDNVHMSFSFGSGSQHTVYDNGLQQLPVYVTVCDDNEDQFSANQILPYLRLYDGDNHQAIGWLQPANGALYTPYANDYQHGRYAVSLAQSAHHFSLGDSTSCDGNSGAKTLTFYLQSSQDTPGKGIYAVYKYSDSHGFVQTLDTTKTVSSTTFSVIPGHFNFPVADFSVNNCSKSGDPDLNYHGYTAHYQCDFAFTKQAGEQIPDLHDIYYSQVSGMPFGAGKDGSPFRLLQPEISGAPHQWKLSFVRPAVEDSLKASVYIKGHDDYGNDIIINHIGNRASTGQYSQNFSLPSDHLEDLEGVLMGVVGQALTPAFNYDQGNWKLSYAPPGASTVSKTLCYDPKAAPHGPYCYPDNYLIFPGDFSYKNTKDRSDFVNFVKQIDAYTGVNGSGSDVQAVTASGAGDGGLSQFVSD